MVSVDLSVGLDLKVLHIAMGIERRAKILLPEE
jgi:hypothetical protein